MMCECGGCGGSAESHVLGDQFRSLPYRKFLHIIFKYSLPGEFID